jgi:AmmeMemoRadiSam system protein B
MANKIDLNLDVWKLIRLVFWTGLVVLIIFLLSGCSEINVSGTGSGEPNYAEWLKPARVIPGEVKGVILPHHLLVKSYMEKFYQQLAAENSYERIVIISPNHFNYGFNFLQTTDWVNPEEQTVDYESRQMLKNAPVLESAWMTVLEAAKVVKIEPKYFSREHGVFTHYGFIKKYFPGAKVLPIIVKRGVSEKALIALGEEINALINAEEGRTLVLASLDFSHYTAEAGRASVLCVQPSDPDGLKRKSDSAEDRGPTRAVAGSRHECAIGDQSKDASQGIRGVGGIREEDVDRVDRGDVGVLEQPQQGAAVDDVLGSAGHPEECREMNSQGEGQENMGPADVEQACRQRQRKRGLDQVRSQMRGKHGRIVPPPETGCTVLSARPTSLSVGVSARPLHVQGETAYGT